jgi:hypothetical protein
MNWYKIALEVVEQLDEDSHYTDIGHDWYYGYEDDFEEGRYNYLWALVDGAIDTEKETSEITGHASVRRWWDKKISYVGRYDSGKRVVSIARHQEGVNQFRQIPQTVQDLLKQAFPKADSLYVY